MCHSDFDILDVAALFISSVSLFSALLAYRLQKVIQLQSLIFIKAQEANEYVSSHDSFREEALLSGIYSAIITGIQLIDVSSTFWRHIISMDHLKHQFYLGLHTSIRLHMQDKITKAPLKNITNPIISKQVEDCKLFFAKSIEIYS